MHLIQVFIILLGTGAVTIVAIRRGGLNQVKCARIADEVCPDNTLDRQEYLDHVSFYHLSEMNFNFVEFIDVLMPANQLSYLCFACICSAI